MLELIDAVARLRDGPDFEVIVSGIGPDLEAARDYADELGLAKRIQFTGYTAYADVPEVYRAANIFVSPTWSEGFSNTILEAMASGLPVISTESVGVVDCLSHERNGLLVACHDVEALATAMQRLIDDDALRRRLAETALADVAETYRWPLVAERIADHYRSVLDTPPDNAWTTLYDPGQSKDRADMSCHFRQQPHLL